MRDEREAAKDGAEGSRGDEGEERAGEDIGIKAQNDQGNVEKFVPGRERERERERW